MLSEQALELLKLHEGYRDRVYKDTVDKQTIGYGWNIDDTPICREAAEVQLKYQVELAEKEVRKAIDFFGNLTKARQEVLVEMSFNMGIKGLMTFKNTLKLMESSKHEEAAAQMLKSKWAEQVGQRARTLAAKYAKG